MNTPDNPETGVIAAPVPGFSARWVCLECGFSWWGPAFEGGAAGPNAPGCPACGADDVTQTSEWRAYEHP